MRDYSFYRCADARITLSLSHQKKEHSEVPSESKGELFLRWWWWWGGWSETYSRIWAAARPPRLTSPPLCVETPRSAAGSILSYCWRGVSYCPTTAGQMSPTVVLLLSPCLTGTPLTAHRSSTHKALKSPLKMGRTFCPSFCGPLLVPFLCTSLT